MTQIVHLEMRLKVIRCFVKRMKCYARIINEYIQFSVVALLNYENLLHHYSAGLFAVWNIYWEHARLHEHARLEFLLKSQENINERGWPQL